MKRALFAALLVVVLAPHEAAARMYQWVSPETGTVQASGTPPPWYRSEATGPRVLVYDNGRLLDDTSIAVPVESAEALREAAFREYEQRQRMDALKRLERAATLEARRRKEKERIESAKLEEDRLLAKESGRTAGRASAEAPAETPTLDQSVIDQLKSLVSEFDKQLPQGAGGAAKP